MNEAGAPMIDLIDFDYGPGHSWWHTLADTPDKCSPNSLEAVGQVILRTLQTSRRRTLSPSSMKTIVVQIPCFNEAATLPLVLGSCRAGSVATRAS